MTQSNCLRNKNARVEAGGEYECLPTILLDLLPNGKRNAEFAAHPRLEMEEALARVEDLAQSGFLSPSERSFLRTRIVSCCRPWSEEVGA
jgi:hypothetical protein